TSGRRPHQPRRRPPPGPGHLRLSEPEGTPEGRPHDHPGAPMSDIITPWDAQGPILVMDLGGRRGQVSARRVREHRIYSEIISPRSSAETIAARRPAGLILSGSPASVDPDRTEPIDADIWNLGIPILGLGG